MKRILLVLTLAAAGSTATWVIREREAARPLELPCAVAREGPIESEVAAPGRVESLRDLTMRAIGEGRVSEVMVREGDEVKAGQELLRYDVADAANRAAQAQDRVAEADLEIQDLDRDLRITRSLIPVAGESKQRLEALEIRRDKARIAKSLAEKELALARLQLERMHGRAPEAGTVVEKQVEVGEWLTPGRPVFLLADVRRLKVAALVDEIDVPRVRVGNRADVSADGVPGRAFGGRVTQIWPSARIERESTVVKVVVELDREVEAGEGLRIGNQVDVRIVPERVEKGVLVPVEAVQENRDGTAVVWVVADGRVSRRAVTVGLHNARDAQVVEGLRVGETVALLLGRVVPDGAPAVPVSPAR